MRVPPLAMITVTTWACAQGPAPYAPIAAPCGSHRIGRVMVTGAPQGAVPQLAVLEGTFDDRARTARVAQSATRALQAQGYADATLAVSRRAGCRTDLEVAVSLGRRYRIVEIAFETDDGFPKADRLSVLEDALGTVNTVGGIYIEYRMQRALDELERRYRDAGWLEATLGPPRTSYADNGTVAVAIPVTAGPRFRIGAVRAVGASPRARAAVLETLEVRAGDYYDGPAIRVALERARSRVARWVELRTNVVGERSEIELEAIVEARR